MEPLNALYSGRRNIAEKQSPRNNIVNPPEYKVLSFFFSKINEMNRILLEVIQYFHIEHLKVKLLSNYKIFPIFF